MHELSVCQALLSQVEQIAHKQAAARVARITIEVGPLCGVDPQLLRNAFAIMRLSGCAAGAELQVQSVEVRIDCLTCGHRAAARPNRLVCSACGGFRTRISAGDELRLLRVEMTVADALPH